MFNINHNVSFLMGNSVDFSVINSVKYHPKIIILVIYFGISTFWVIYHSKTIMIFI